MSVTFTTPLSINAFYNEDRNAKMAFTTAATRMGGTHFDFTCNENE